MTDYRPNGKLAEPITATYEPIVACPTCNAALAFRRSSASQIDACGFESYRLECTECGAPLAGIVDPSDDTLLLTEMAA